MILSRRDFLRYCGFSAAALGLSSADLGLLEKALAAPDAPTVLWLQGSCCCGCSISLLNRVSHSAPQSVDDLLLNSINLAFHPTLMSAAGEQAVSVIKDKLSNPNYILVVEGGIPTAFGGNACVVWSADGSEVTFGDAVLNLAQSASAVISIGTCACFGGIGAAPPNPTGITSVERYTGKPTINISGCPVQPDWFIWTVVQFLLGRNIPLDEHRRPLAIYGRTIHSTCPFREREEAERFGLRGHCLEELGCRGPETFANCHQQRWNNGVSWCAEAGAPCYGCTEPGFPGAGPLWGGEGEDEDDDDDGDRDDD